MNESHNVPTTINRMTFSVCKNEAQTSEKWNYVFCIALKLESTTVESIPQEMCAIKV